MIEIKTSTRPVPTLNDDYSLRTFYPKEETFLERLSSFFSNYIAPTGKEFSSPIQLGGFDPLRPHIQKPHYVFGDIHGELRGLIENLLHAGLIDQEGNWSKKDVTFVQLGDVIDRGIFSEEAWDYLGELQVQAKESQGRVVRLLGNHELLVLQGNNLLAKWVIPNVGLFAEKMKKEILEGQVKLAYTDGKRLFIHAGIRTEIRNQLLYELKERLQKPTNQIYIEDLVHYMNQLLLQAVETGDFSHPIFNVGVSRGGNQLIGGVLWEDIREIVHSKKALDIPQVIGHNPPVGPEMPPIRITESQKLVEVDAGMNPLYGGQKAYVFFDEYIHIVVKKESEWVEQVAKDILFTSHTRRG